RTAHHKLSVIANQFKNRHIYHRKNTKFIKADELKVGNCVAVLNKVKREENTLLKWITPELSLLIGLLLGDGWINKRGRAIFRNTSSEILDLFEAACSKIGQSIGRGKETIRVNIGAGRGGNDRKEKPITQKGAPLLWLAQWMGLAGQNAENKKLSFWMRQLSEESAAAILRGLLLSDGCIGKYGDISFGSYSKNLRDWVSDTAHRLGCPGRIKTIVDSYGKELHMWWAFSEFVDDLVRLIGPMTGKNNRDKLFQKRINRTKRRHNNQFHQQKILSVTKTPVEASVCVTVLEGDSHVYCTPILESNTLEDVLFGRVQGAAPAYQVNLRINVAKSKLSPLAQHLAVGATEIIDRFLRGVEQLGEAIVIEGERITVAMAKEYRGRVTASIQPKSPVDRTQDIGAAVMAQDFGMPWDWIVEEILGIEDPATLRLMKDIQELEELPPVKERLMQEALEQLELLVEEDEMEELTEGSSAGLPPEFGQAVEQLLGGAGEAGQRKGAQGALSGRPERGAGPAARHAPHGRRSGLSPQPVAGPAGRGGPTPAAFTCPTGRL
ncbi:hypothetical protein LCGC14_2206030, partial [marine sediment metagenome]